MQLWTGKEALVEALASVVAACPSVFAADATQAVSVEIGESSVELSIHNLMTAMSAEAMRRKASIE